MHLERTKIQRLIDLVAQAGTESPRTLTEADGGWLNQLAIRPPYQSHVEVPQGLPLHVYVALHEVCRESGQRTL